MEFGAGRFFRSSHGFFYNLQVMAPPTVDCPGSAAQNPQGSSARLVLGHFANTGYVWLDWRETGFMHNGALLSGLSGQRPQRVGTFEAWLLRSFKAAGKLYSREEWAARRAPVVPFTAEEQRVLDAIPRFTFRKVGVSTSGAILVEVSNQSAIELPFLSVGVRAVDGMEGSAALPVSGIKPGLTKTIEVSLYRGSMDPDGLSLFRLPIPDEGDRELYLELRAVEGRP